MPRDLPPPPGGPSGLPSRPRHLGGIAVAMGVALIQAVSQYVANHDAVRLASVLLFLLFEMPAVMIALSALYRAARRRAFGALPMVAGGIALSGAIGAAFGFFFEAASALVPQLGHHLSIVQPLSAVRTVLFGFTYGVGHFGLWTLAFALPIALEADRLRAAAAPGDRHRRRPADVAAGDHVHHAGRLPGAGPVHPGEEASPGRRRSGRRSRPRMTPGRRLTSTPSAGATSSPPA